MALPASVRAIGRAGAGTNNIPVKAMSGRGVPVFNAPGANANAVKELVIAGMLLSVPLMVMTMITLAQFPKTKPIAVFMSENGEVN